MKHRDKAPRNVWSMFYDDKYDGNEYTNCEKCEISSKQNEIYVYEGRFISLRSGSMNITSNGIKFLHSSCFYNDCSRKEFGGAIFFNCQSSIVQHRFCTTNTYIIKGNGFHSYTICMNDYKNHVIESSISSCKRLSDYIACRIIEIENGNDGVFSSNISKNSVYCFSGFHVHRQQNLCVINFSTFEGNFASQNICLGYSNSFACFKTYKCNVISNTQNNDASGIISASSELIVENCTIFGSYGSGKPFAIVLNGKIKVINCNLDNIQCYFRNTKEPNPFVLDSYTFARESNLLPHISTYLCFAKLKFSGTI